MAKILARIEMLIKKDYNDFTTVIRLRLSSILWKDQENDISQQSRRSINKGIILYQRTRLNENLIINGKQSKKQSGFAIAPKVTNFWKAWMKCQCRLKEFQKYLYQTGFPIQKNQRNSKLYFNKRLKIYQQKLIEEQKKLNAKINGTQIRRKLEFILEKINGKLNE